MPRILTKKRLALLIVAGLILTVAILVALPFFLVVLLLYVIVIAVLLINRKIKLKIYSELSKFGAARGIKPVDTLIIGDCINLDKLTEKIKPSNPVAILAPGRGLESSFLLLKHLSGILEKNGRVIIISPAKEQNTEIFDYPFWSLVTKKNHKLRHHGKELSFPIFFNPIQSIRFFYTSQKTGCVAPDCNHPDIDEYCKRKGYELCYLKAV